MKKLPYYKGKNPLVGAAFEYARNPVSFAQKYFSVYGDTFRFKFLNRSIILTKNADYTQHILQKNHSNYIKNLGYRKLKILLGEGLFTSEGGVWKKNRKIIIQGSFFLFRSNQ